MVEESNNIQISLRGLFSTYGKGRRIASMDVCGRVRDIRDVPACKDEISEMLRDFYYDTPEAHLLWAEKLFGHGHRRDGFDFVCSALMHARYDKNSGIIISTAIKIMNRNGFEDYADATLSIAARHFPNNAILTTQRIQKLIEGSSDHGIALLEAERRKHPDDAAIINMQGNAYIKADRSDDAIVLLERERLNHPHDEAMANILGNAYITADRPNDAITLLEGERSDHSENSYLITTLCNAYIMVGRLNDAIVLLEAEHREDSKDAAIVNTLGYAYIMADRSNDAITLLERERRNYPNNAIMVNVLGKAYITANRPNDAIVLLENERRNHPKDAAMISTLANAYVSVQDFYRFERIAGEISIPSLRDYLYAKLHYLDGNSQRAMLLLNPYVHTIESCPRNMIGLYMACISDDHELHTILPESHGHTLYRYLLQCRDGWRENPMRAELTDNDYSNTQTMYELGANPASRADRKKAGMDTSVPVHVRP